MKVQRYPTPILALLSDGHDEVDGEGCGTASGAAHAFVSRLGEPHGTGAVRLHSGEDGAGMAAGE